MVIDETHRLNGAHWCPSPHCGPPAGQAGGAEAGQFVWQPELIIIHCISLPSGEFGTGLPSQLFTGRLDCESHPSLADLAGLRVAPHLFVDRNGQVEQFVPFNLSAWHAGVSSWAGRRSCNHFSLGIELEGTWHQPFTDAQYQALIPICAALCRRYPSLSPSAIVGHQEVAPGRKEDPGPYFDWPRLLAALHSLMFASAPQVENAKAHQGGNA